MDGKNAILALTSSFAVKLSTKVLVLLMSDDFEDNRGLIDDDPALDCIIYEDMNKEERRPGGTGGCLSLILILFLPALYFIIRIAVT